MLEGWVTAIVAFVTAVGTVAYQLAQRRRIQQDAGSIAADIERMQDERTRHAYTDALQAEQRASKWADAFRRAYRWIVNHMTDHHPAEAPPPRDLFVDDDDTNPG